MLSAIILSAALAAGGCDGADYDIAFTEDGVQSSIANFVKEGDGYVAELPILEGGTIAPGINEQKTVTVCNHTKKQIRLKATKQLIVVGGEDAFFGVLMVYGVPVRELTIPLPLQGIDGETLQVSEAANTVLDYNFHFDVTSGNRVNTGWEKAIVKIRVKAEYPDPPKTENTPTSAATLDTPDKPNMPATKPIISTPLAVIKSGIMTAIGIGVLTNPLLFPLGTVRAAGPTGDEFKAETRGIPASPIARSRETND